MSILEMIGCAVGAALAPWAALGSFLRQARLFHPDGLVYWAEVTPIAQSGRARAVAERLSGPALVRLSSAVWKGGKAWPDVLGVAVRFRSEPRITVEPSPGDQDLLFATARRPWTVLWAPLSTNVHDFLANDYFGMSPFDVRGFGRARLRLVTPHERAKKGASRREALARAASEGEAVFVLQAKRLHLGARYVPIAEILLIEPVFVDQAALAFSPFRAGRGIKPRGFVHALRRAVYPASRFGRPRARVSAAADTRRLP